MTISRYARSPNIKGGGRGSSNACVVIKAAIDNNAIRFTRRTLKQGERLDTIAGQVYGNGALWWIIAAASGIGWCLQIPGGTVITIPDSLADIELLVG